MRIGTGTSNDSNQKRAQRIATGLLALTKTNGGPLDAVWCDGFVFRIRRECYGATEWISWAKAEQLIRSHQRRKAAQVVTMKRKAASA